MIDFDTYIKMGEPGGKEKARFQVYGYGYVKDR